MSHCSLNFEAPCLEYGFLLIVLVLENCKFRSLKVLEFCALSMLWTLLVQSGHRYPQGWQLLCYSIAVVIVAILTSVVVLGLGPWPSLRCPQGQILSPWPWRSSPCLEQMSLALSKQVLGLAGLVICQTNNTATMLKSTFIARMTLLLW